MASLGILEDVCGRNNESDLTMEGGTTDSGDILSCMLKVMDMRPISSDDEL